MARLVKNRCSFCGKRHDQVRRVIAGPGGVLICNECVALCNTIIDEQERGAGPQLGTTGPWWRRGLVAVGRVIQGQRQRRPSWRGSIG